MFKLVLLFLSAYTTYSYKMAVIVWDISNSQLLFNVRVAEVLANAGHDVTIVCISSMSDRDNSDIKINSKVKVHSVYAPTNFTRKDMEDKQEEFVYGDLSALQLMTRFSQQTQMIVETCSGRFRVLPLKIHAAEIPTWIWLSSGTVMDYMAYLIGIPTIPSYVPPVLMTAVGEMTFTQRTKSLIGHALTKFFWKRQIADPEMELFRTYISPAFPDILELAAKCSLEPQRFWEPNLELFLPRAIPDEPLVVVSNYSCFPKAYKEFDIWPDTKSLDSGISHLSGIAPQDYDYGRICAKLFDASKVMANTNELYDIPRPTLAKVVQIGGIGMERKDAKPLPKDIQAIVDDGDGVIIFSFGSVAPAHKMPGKWKKIFLKTFEKFPKYKVLWRYEKDDLKALLPPNVHAIKWLPQTDLLRHPKTKVFITHGGFNSIQESINTGVPVISIPLFGDQPKNALLAKHHGFGLILQKSEISVETVSAAIKEIISNTRYATAANRMSNMVKHKPVSPAHLLVRWAEFVAEFKTLENLEPAGNKLNFIQYHSLDVILALSVLVIIVFTLAAVLLRYIVRRLIAATSVFKTKRD